VINKFEENPLVVFRINKSVVLNKLEKRPSWFGEKNLDLDCAYDYQKIDKSEQIGEKASSSEVNVDYELTARMDSENYLGIC